MKYYRPIVRPHGPRPEEALTLAGGWCWFSEVEEIARGGPRRLVPAASLPEDVRAVLTAPRAPVAGVSMARPVVMGIVNVTPDSFSDGGLFDCPEAAVSHARALCAAGADILDIGGESTRPGAADVPEDEEIARTAPVIADLRAQGVRVPISVDTRKAAVGRAALAAGADFLNDVAAFSYDAGMAALAAHADVPVCLMHAQGAPATMQESPRYDDVVLDVYDFLATRVADAEAAGIDRARIVVDPGIGFGKTLAHNLALLRGLSLFHALGCPVLLGASRKRFIGALADLPQARERMPGSVAVALAGVAQGVQILRVHDVGETRQALTVTQAIWKDEDS
ncbi:dihydropteroate synthase [Rhodovulum imhoffii]|uniref:Dihydropteroate synthase n=1 Tax=Rhodovulum imhoffii TaxID=365340 RepID=A0A2T5BQP2_9RHOB|nr:dihydropteroate synthase [Rhodovulum imhoffii]MBK5933904.1 dihydropteroate synthase [Rhodovulum imhoffii]PTN01508.1 dihydropteroate synthase [Rhodovulum imhoffii]